MPQAAAPAAEIRDPHSTIRLVTSRTPAVVAVQKRASVTRGLVDGAVELSPGGPTRPGDIVVVEALEEKRTYDQLELVTGRLVHISRGDVIAGTLGARQALKGFVGICPTAVHTGDTLHVLNLGGVIGIATSTSTDFGVPLRVRVLGLAVRDGVVLNIGEGAIAAAERLTARAPLVLVVGTCMAAGKTQAACAIIGRLAARGLRVAGVKLSGVAALKDTLNMLDHGAVRALSFLDAGLPSTVGIEDLPGLARGLLNELDRHAPDVIVVEMGDGIIGGYGVASFYADPSLRAAVAVHVVCANDLVGAWGAAELARRLGRPADIISGPATDNAVGERYIESELGIAAANARSAGERLAELVLAGLPPVPAR